MSVCPICGGKIGDGMSAWMEHKCNPRSLRAIDAAHDHADLEPGLVRRETEATRLNDGLAMFDEDEEDD